LLIELETQGGKTMNKALCLLPQEAYLPVMVLAGLLVIIGFRKIGFGIYLSILVLAFTKPILSSFKAMLPPWMQCLLAIGGMFMIIRFVLGRNVMENVLSFLVYDLLKICLLLPCRFVAWTFRGRAKGR
jgi:hypothetical protein